MKANYLIMLIVLALVSLIVFCFVYTLSPDNNKFEESFGGRDGGFDSGRGRDGGFDSGRGRDGGFGSARGRGGDGFGSGRGRDGGFGSGRGRGGDGFGSGRGCNYSYRNNDYLPYYYDYVNYVPYYNQDSLRIKIPVGIDIKDNISLTPSPKENLFF